MAHTSSLQAPNETILCGSLVAVAGPRVRSVSDIPTWKQKCTAAHPCETYACGPLSAGVIAVSARDAAAKEKVRRTDEKSTKMTQPSLKLTREDCVYFVHSCDPDGCPAPFSSVRLSPTFSLWYSQHSRFLSLTRTTAAASVPCTPVVSYRRKLYNDWRWLSPLATSPLPQPKRKCVMGSKTASPCHHVNTHKEKEEMRERKWMSV